MPKRAPIEYTPAFGGGVFRAKEVVAEEFAATTGNDPDTNAITEIPAPAAPSTPTRERSNERTNGRAPFL